MREAERPSPGQRVVLAAIGVYRSWLSPLKTRSTCRFSPTCSEYAARAVMVHGVGPGVRLAARRLLRCHPWQPPAYDPVPEPEGGKAVGFRHSNCPG